MTKSAMLLAHRRVKPAASANKKPSQVDEEDYEIVWELALPSNVSLMHQTLSSGIAH